MDSNDADIVVMNIIIIIFAGFLILELFIYLNN